MIDENVLERLKPYLTEVSYPKGYVLFNSEKLERNIYFIKRGMARAFVEADGRDVTIWFGQEGDVAQVLVGIHAAAGKIRGEGVRDDGASGGFGIVPGERDGFTGFVS